MKFEIDYEWVCFICYYYWHFHVQSGCNDRGGGAPNDFERFERQYRPWYLDYTGYSLMMTILMVLLGRLSDLYGRV